MFNPSIFKAYDIRGVYPTELNEELAYALGRAVVEFSGAKTVVVGRDSRVSSPSLARELIRGLTDAGVQVADIGLASTPLLNFSVANYPEHDFGVMVSASHNPAQYNGFKLTDSSGLPVGKETGMEKVKELTLNSLKSLNSLKRKKGEITVKEHSEEYLDKIFSFVDVAKIKPLKLVADTANGMGGLLIDKVMARLPQIQASYLFKDLDGRFPNHEANPLKHETLADLRKKAREEKADLGAAYDGDGDRIGFVDEKGEVVQGDFLTALLAEQILKQKPGGLILGDVRFSWAASEYIKEKGGRFALCPVGHALIKKILRDRDAVFGGELSLHFYYQNFFGAESGDLTLLYLLEMLSETGQPLSALVQPLRRYWQSGEINFTVQDKETIIQRLVEKYRPLAKSFLDIDGIRFDFDDWWFNVRPSNTEPLLRLNLEAKTEKEMGERVGEISQIISNYSNF